MLGCSLDQRFCSLKPYSLWAGTKTSGSNKSYGIWYSDKSEEYAGAEYVRGRATKKFVYIRKMRYKKCH